MCPHQLPNLEGTTLSGRRIEFPRDLPETGLTLVIGFTHAARHDVGAWKAALSAKGLPFLSLPTSALDAVAEDLKGVADAMRAHVPGGAWEQVVQVHRGGAALLEAFGWQADACAKALRVTGEGAVLARHDSGTFTSGALAAFLG